MDFNFYQNKFREAADRLDGDLLEEKQIEAAVGVYLDSVFLKLYKKAWANPSPYPLTSDSRIFFSIWIYDLSIEKQKMFYNIHALKLRKLSGYKIESRKFADRFRAKFSNFEDRWQNVSVKFGPQTLMEGWVNFDPESFQDQILKLADNFLKIEYLIDENLEYFKLNR